MSGQGTEATREIETNKLAQIKIYSLGWYERVALICSIDEGPGQD
jgi:hypothetical protein